MHYVVKLIRYSVPQCTKHGIYKLQLKLTACSSTAGIANLSITVTFRIQENLYVNSKCGLLTGKQQSRSFINT